MYFAMDEIGSDNMERMRGIKSIPAKWQMIDQIAAEYGYQGIQFTPSLYEEQLGLRLEYMPEYLRMYRLTLHLGGTHALDVQADKEKLEDLLQKSLQLAAKYSMEDVSLHPPVMTEGSDRAAVRQCFKKILQAWLPHFTTQGVTLSVENHAHEKYWVFTGPADFADFVSSITGIGALIDISHSVNDGYTVEHILSELGQLNVTGLHLSDAISLVDMRSGTHLPVGRGQVDFEPFLRTFSRRPNVYGALEIKGQSAEIADSLARLRAGASR